MSMWVGLAPWVKEPALLWLWCRPAAAAPTSPLAREPPYAVGVALKQTNKPKETGCMSVPTNQFLSPRDVPPLVTMFGGKIFESVSVL